MDDGLGTLAHDGDRWTLTFTRRLPHPPGKVWRAVTEPEHLAAWFPQEIVGDRRAGAALRFVMSGGDEFSGEMIAFDPPSIMKFMWGTDLLTIELQADGDGTVLTLTDSFAEQGKAARDAAGWHECIDRLVAELDGNEQRPWGEPWRDLFALYGERFGPEATTMRPPAGYEPGS